MTGSRGPTLPGVYGLAVEGLPSGPLFVGAPPHWPGWHVGWSRVDPDASPPPEIHGDGHVLTSLVGQGWMDIDGETRSTRLFSAAKPSLDAWAHPHLALTGALAARWSGEVSLHCGVVAIGGRAWGLLGDKEAGKTTTLAALHAAGAGVVSDDMLVVRNHCALAGPRALDLRDGPAQHLGLGVEVGGIGGRERWRMYPGPVAAETPLAGFVRLGWSDRLEVGHLAGRERLPTLLEHATVRRGPTNPAQWFVLASLPILTLDRPRGLHALAAATETLLLALAGG